MKGVAFTSKDKELCRQRLEALLASYEEKMSGLDKSKVSEETVRSWLNEFLKVFGWDVKDVRQVLQETNLAPKEKARLGKINSKHKRPDYTLLDSSRIATFLDAKALSVDVFTDKAAAFQIRSYGWSAQVPCAFISNFEQLAVFDTRYVPEPGQSAQNGVIQIARNQYIAKFDILFDRLWHGNVTAGLDTLNYNREFAKEKLCRRALKSWLRIGRRSRLTVATPNTSRRTRRSTLRLERH